jgi:exonuclease III
VRGLNDRSRRDIVKSFVLSIKPMIVWLQETKLCSISAFDILSILGAGYNNFVYTPAHGTRGGILVACRDGVYSSIGSLVRDFSVSVKLQEESGAQWWWFTGVYGPHQDNLKQSFLQELREIRETCTCPRL